jgi:tetratricopeptide (TPR) repeat protein
MKLQETGSPKFILCQKCKAVNELGLEYCLRCGTKLLIVKGVTDWEQNPEASGMDEHLLERITSLEEALQNQGKKIEILLDAMQKQERGITLDLSGLLALTEVLQRWRVLDEHELYGTWEDNLRQRITEIELKALFFKRKNSILSRFRGDNPSAFEHLVNAGEDKIVDGDIGGGILLLKKALKLDPRNPELLYSLGEMYYYLNEPSATKRFLEKSLRKEPQHLNSLLLLGLMAREEDRIAQAEEYFARAAKVPGANPVALLSLVFTCVKLEDYDRALDLLEEARIPPSSSEMPILMGYLFLQTGKPAKAAPWLEKAIHTDASHEEAFHLLGVCCLKKNQIKKARKLFSSDPLEPFFQQNLLRLLKRPLYESEKKLAKPLPMEAPSGAWPLNAMGFPESSRRSLLPVYLHALQQEPANRALLKHFAQYCIEFHFMKHAEDALVRLMNQPLDEQETAWANTLKAYVASVTGEAESARDTLLHVLEQTRNKKSRFLPYYELAREIAEAGINLEEALTYACEASKLATKKFRSFPLALLGWIHFQKKDYVEASIFFSQVHELHPFSEIAFFLAVSLLACEKTKDAEPLFMTAFNLNPEFSSLQRIFRENINRKQFEFGFNPMNP